MREPTGLSWEPDVFVINESVGSDSNLCMFPGSSGSLELPGSADLKNVSGWNEEVRACMCICVRVHRSIGRDTVYYLS